MERNPGPASPDVIRDLLQDAIEMHVHGGPDIVPRKLSDIGLLRAAKDAGLGGVMLKCHETPTASRAALAQETVAGILAFGGVALNKPLGGLNPALVESELKLGAKEIWLPTRSALDDITYNGRNPRDAVPLTGPDGRLVPQLHEILELIAASGAILGTGHISADECEAVALAKQKGVQKIIITHPEAPRIAMDLETQRRLAARGAVFEWVALNLTTLTEGRGQIPPQVYARNIRNVGASLCIMATDFGQTNNPEPAAGLYSFIRTMLEHGISPAQIRLMVRDNPRQMLGLV